MQETLEGQEERSGRRDRELAPGGVLDGRFVIERVLGRGGMGCVLLAKHVELEQRVAIKVLESKGADEARENARVLREARAAARIQSEHVVRVHDVAAAHAVPYIVMEYLRGQDLSQHLAERGALSVRAAAAIVIQAAEAIGEGHGLGIVHRDLKPANLFLCERAGAEPRVKVLDFGISKSLGDEAELTTQSYALIGSPFYAAPEQLECSRTVDGRADIWSLGVILYEMVAGKRPFASGSLAQVCTRILQEPPTPIERVRPDLPPAFAAVVMRSLEKDPARRYQSAQELVSALAPFGPEEAKRSLAYLSGLQSGSGGFSTGFSRTLTPDGGGKSESDASTLTISGAGDASMGPRHRPRRLAAQLFVPLVVAGGLLLALALRFDWKARASNAAPPPVQRSTVRLPADRVASSAVVVPEPGPTSDRTPDEAVQRVGSPTAGSAPRKLRVPKRRPPSADVLWVESR
jgi:serine/threonine-protein kinase